MPTYDYRCKDCATDLEVVQKFTDDALTECPECGGNLRKVYSAVGVVFKGSGFYRTDSRAADQKRAAGSDSQKSGEKSGSKSESSSNGSGGSTSNDSSSSASTNGSGSSGSGSSGSGSGGSGSGGSSAKSEKATSSSGPTKSS